MLNERWERFCQLYVESGGNASQSYLEAGFETDNVHSTAACASRLLKNANIQLRISQIRSKHHSRFQVSQEMIIDKLVSIVFEGSKIAEIDENGELKLIPHAEVADVDSISYSKSDSEASGHGEKGSNSSSSSGTSVSIKNKDKVKALDMLCKILGIYERRDSSNSTNFNGNSQRALDALRKLRNKDEASEDSGE